jgi:hypothetical protein
LLLLLLFAFCFTPFFEWTKATKLKEKSKIKKKEVRIHAIIGQIRTPDLDPGHFGPDIESASTDLSPCAALTHSRLVDFYGLFSGIQTQF